MGIARGDRVGISLHKSIDSVAWILGVLKCGAAYVPADVGAPAGRTAFVFHDCSVKAAITETSLVGPLGQAMRDRGDVPPLIALEGVGGGGPVRLWLDAEDTRGRAPSAPDEESEPDDLAYILYTSGSTGNPKGVMLSHLNAQRFIDWCSETFEPRADDRFSSHAPFHFDLSVFDIYVSLIHGATLVLIPEATGKEPLALADLIERERMTVWYSTPSILTLLTQYGKLEGRDLSPLRLVLFAGEVFPIVHLRALRKRVPGPRYFNLYGPTETNVCTYYELPGLENDDRSEPYPIGTVCPHYKGLVADGDGNKVTRGHQGELLIQGDGVMQGYWNLPEQNKRAFLDLGARGRWYRTGDVVTELPSGDLKFIGRKDRMVKRRGYRVELGEIEACLYKHPRISEAAAVAVEDEGAGVKVIAHVAAVDGGRMSMIELKQFCSQNLPLYFVPDLFQFHEKLPKTSTAKIDYQRLMSQRDVPPAGKP
jgi:amino acid adenylation domain-containing protein